jgi:rhodanese-related sulfurtransferase
MATPAEIRRAVAANATIIDLRSAAEHAEDPMVAGALHAEWDKDNATMPDMPLPADRPVVVY